MKRHDACWRFNFYGTEYLAWTAAEFHALLDRCEQDIGETPELWLRDMGSTTWEEHRQLTAMGRLSHGE